MQLVQHHQDTGVQSPGMCSGTPRWRARGTSRRCRAGTLPLLQHHIARTRALNPCLCLRDNTLEARRHKQALLCWQRTGLRKAWLTWRDHMATREQALQALRVVAMRLQAPVMSSAWQAWGEFTARRGAKRVRPGCAGGRACSAQA